ncbi:hypothetical protein MRX96_013104 [Rhipicephalus microplus]
MRQKRTSGAIVKPLLGSSSGPPPSTPLAGSGRDLTAIQDRQAGYSRLRAVAGRKILTLLLPRVGNNPSGGFILLPGDFFAEDHLLERHPRSVSLGKPS